MTTPITSAKDDRITLIRSLSTRSSRYDNARCVLEGASLIEQALHSGVALEFALRAEGPADELSEQLKQAGVPVHPTREALLRQALRASRPVQWLAVAPLPKPCKPDEPYGDFAVVLDHVADPGNLGSIVRTACGLGVLDVVTTDLQTDLTGRKTVDASRGSVLRARIRQFPTATDAIQSLQAHDFEVVATSPHGEHLQSMVPLSGRSVALVVGNETSGVGEDVLALADHVVRIPMAGEIESLNVGVSTGISVYELRARMILAALSTRARGSLAGLLGDGAFGLRTTVNGLLNGLEHVDGDQLTVLILAAGQDKVTKSAVLAGGLSPERAELMLSSLTTRGYLADDGRITDLGRAAVAAHWTSYQQAEDVALRGFSGEDRKRLTALLLRVRENCER